MAITFTPIATTNYPVGFPLNSSEWNSRMDELESQISSITNDIGPRHIIITGVCGENITAGNVVRIGTSGNIFKADNGSTTGYTGIIGIALETKLTTETVRITTNILAGTSGLTAGDRYYLSTAGAITNIAPSTVIIIGYALSSTVLILLKDRQDFGDVLTINDATNRVGINNTNPSAALHVTSGSTGFSSIFGRFAGAGNTTGLFLHSEASEAHYNWKISTQDVVGAACTIQPSTAVGGTSWANPVLIVAQTNRVGINQLLPSAALHVKSGAASGTYSAIIGANAGAANTSGLFFHSDAAETHYNWKISTQDTVGAAITMQPSTAVGGTTWDTSVLTVTQTQDVYTLAFQDISASITMNGFSATTTKQVWMKKIGKTCYFEINVNGTGNATTFSLSGFPITFSSNFATPMGHALNNGGFVVAYGSASGTTLNIIRDGGTNWANGEKEFRIAFVAEAT